MKNLIWSVLSAVALMTSPGVLAAEGSGDLEALKKELHDMRENFGRMIREQQTQIESLKKQLEASRTNLVPAATPPTVPATTEQRLPSAAATPIVSTQPWSATQPIRLGTAQNYINLSFDGLFGVGTSTEQDIESLQLGGHDPKQRGFTVQNLETVFEGRVDPYFRGQANVILQIDPEGETVIEAEEAYLETMSLPWNLQVKGGQFFAEFGRLNPIHPHAWDFVDQPLVNGRFLGGDGLRNPGARISWLMPTPFYSEIFFAVQDSHGETAHSFRNGHEGETFFGRLHDPGRVESLGDMLFLPRYAASVDLTESQTLLAGASAAFGPNGSGSGADTQIYGIDLFWKWKPVNHHAGFPFVSWQTEAMFRRYQAAAFDWDLNGDGVADPDEISDPATGLPVFLPRETLTDYGLYSQVAYGFRKGWVAALRGDYVFPDKRGFYESLTGADPARAARWRISPDLTYYPSEFSKIRLQYNFDRRNGIGDDHSVWMQFEFLLGSHAAHKF